MERKLIMPVEQAKNFWLMKSEPNVFSIDDLANCNKKTEPWSGVRNYQARNFMRDDMAVGDMILFLSLELCGAWYRWPCQSR